MLHWKPHYPSKGDINFLAAQLSPYVLKRRLSSRLARDLDIHKNLLHFHLCTYLPPTEGHQVSAEHSFQSHRRHLHQQAPPPGTDTPSAISQHKILDYVLPKLNTSTHFERERAGYEHLWEYLPRKRQWGLLWGDTCNFSAAITCRRT